MLSRILCWFVGHDDIFKIDKNILYVECLKCGRRTNGLVTGRKAA